MPHKRIGIIANPVSARDIRRITSHAASLTLGERANMLVRIVSALAASGMDEVVLMPEAEGLRRHFEHLLPAAAQEAAYPLPALRWLDMPVRNHTGDSVRAARMMREEGAAAVLVLGGDGTHRAAVKGCGGMPVAGISTGTNNAFPPMREATVTAWAAGLYAALPVPDDLALSPNKILRVRRFNAHGTLIAEDIALVDAAVLNEAVPGAKAIGPDTLRTIAVTMASPEAVGLSAVAAALQPVGREEAGGLLVELQPGCAQEAPPFCIRAALAPGRIANIRIHAFFRLPAGEVYRVGGQAGLVALDGEREMVFLENERIEIELQENAFHTLNVPAILAYARLRHPGLKNPECLSEKPDTAFRQASPATVRTEGENS